MISFMNRFLIAIALLSVVLRATALQIPTQFKEAVAFVYAPLTATNAAPDGTGFFVGVPSTKYTNVSAVYLVTAKHVLQDKNKCWRSHVFLRLNRHDGTLGWLLCPLSAAGTNKNVFIHPDAGVDLAVFGCAPAQDTYDYTILGDSLLTTKPLFKQLGIREGTEVFFTGMFVNHLGTKRNLPLFRFGRVSLVSDEPVYFNGQFRDLYLIEANSFGGNSGSPVYFITGYESPPGVSLAGSGTTSVLAGVLSGRFNDEADVIAVETGTKNATFPSLGITSVVPAYKLRELLYSDEVVAARQ
jgi:hypothetical protein